MPKPKTKTELLDAAEAQYAKLDSLIEGMSSDDQHTHFDPSITQIGKEAHWARDKNLRDVLAHLHEWQSMLRSTSAFSSVSSHVANHANAQPRDLDSISGH